MTKPAVVRPMSVEDFAPMLKETTIATVAICVLFGGVAVFVDFWLFGSSPSDSNNYISQKLERESLHASFEVIRLQSEARQFGAVEAVSTGVDNQGASDVQKESIPVDNPYLQLLNDPSLRDRSDRSEGMAMYLSSVITLDPGEIHLSESEEYRERDVVQVENPYEALISNAELQAGRISAEAELLSKEGVASRSELYLRSVTGGSN